MNPTFYFFTVIVHSHIIQNTNNTTGVLYKQPKQLNDRIGSSTAVRVIKCFGAAPQATRLINTRTIKY